MYNPRVKRIVLIIFVIFTFSGLGYTAPVSKLKFDYNYTFDEVAKYLKDLTMTAVSTKTEWEGLT